MTTALATLPASNGQIQHSPGFASVVRTLDDVFRLAEVFFESGLLQDSIKSVQMAAVIILKGHELRIPPMESFSAIAVIKGKPTTSPQTMLGLINRSGLMEDMTFDDDGEKAIVMMKRRDRSPITKTFSMEDARLMGLAGQDQWKKQPKTMRQWRAFGATSRIVFPDVIGGLYLHEEMGARVDDDGELLNGEIIEAEVVQARPQKFLDNGSGHGNSGSYGSPEQVKATKAVIAAEGIAAAERWSDRWAEANGHFPTGLPEYPFDKAKVARRTLMSAVEQKKLEPVPMATCPSTNQPIPDASTQQTIQLLAVVHAREPLWFEQTIRGIFGEEATRCAGAFIAENPSLTIPVAYEDYDDVPEAEQQSQDDTPPPAVQGPKKLSKRELAESVRDRLAAEAKARAAADDTEHGDAYEEAVTAGVAP